MVKPKYDKQSVSRKKAYEKKKYPSIATSKRYKKKLGESIIVDKPRPKNNNKKPVTTPEVIPISLDVLAEVEKSNPSFIKQIAPQLYIDNRGDDKAYFVTDSKAPPKAASSSSVSSRVSKQLQAARVKNLQNLMIDLRRKDSSITYQKEPIIIPRSITEMKKLEDAKYTLPNIIIKNNNYFQAFRKILVALGYKYKSSDAGIVYDKMKKDLTKKGLNLSVNNMKNWINRNL